MRALLALCAVALVGVFSVVGAPVPPDKLGQRKDGPLGMKFVFLPKGTFYMGWKGDNKSTRKTVIKEDFEIAVHTVTQGQWQELMGKNPSSFSRDGKGKDSVKAIKDEDLKLFPVEMVSWNDAQEFIGKLNDREKGRGYLYRLPTEAEWEYACRGGSTSEEECSYPFYVDKPTNELSSKQANFNGEDRDFDKGEKGPNLARPTKVGSYTPNKLGLYDMHGNVWQWCQDSNDDNTRRVHKGGGWSNPAYLCQAGQGGTSLPTIRNPDVGFRLVRVAFWEKTR
jgi:formylglycine-generating enzyme required for sulfatase activity